MLTFLKSAVVSLCIALTLFSCSDHRLGGALSPVRLRLKSFTDGTGTTAYTYDSQNRIATIARPDGSLGVFSYDDPNKKTIYFYEYPNPADRSKGRTTLYPFESQQYSSNPDLYQLIGKQYATADPAELDLYISRDYIGKLFNYIFDASKKISSYYTANGSNEVTSRNGAGYTYTGENINRVTGIAGRVTVSPFIFAYDDKINPFFGLMDPDVDPRARYSRNNPIKAELTGSPNINRFYTYEYNAQNLPVKRTESGLRDEVTTFTYEPY